MGRSGRLVDLSLGGKVELLAISIKRAGTGRVGLGPMGSRSLDEVLSGFRGFVRALPYRPIVIVPSPATDRAKGHNTEKC
jgi:hypothetical protein